MIKASKYAGADYINFKKNIQRILRRNFRSTRTSPWGTTNREQKMGLEFGEKEYDEIDKYCKNLNIKWFASAWDQKN